MSDRGLRGRLAHWAASRERLPTAQRAVLGYYAETGTFDYRAVDLKSTVDDVMAEILDEVYADVEDALEAVFDEPVDFTYETKLTLPAELTLGYLFRRAKRMARGNYDPVTGTRSTGRFAWLPRLDGRRERVSHHGRANGEAAMYASEARAVTRFVVVALLDGDMRDAINDDEYEDFVVDFPSDRTLSSAERETVATTAQAALQRQVDEGFAAYPDRVKAAYDHAVEVSEAHQEEDERFRELMAAAAGDGQELSPAAAREAIEAEYKHRPMADDDHPFTEAELELPYLATQYDRVGVIYHGMLEMYRAVGFDIEPAFERSIVFSIIGAQVWLDDVDDYADDVDDGQLTPVTAEYLLRDDAEAFEAVVDLANEYFDRARRYATAADSTLTGIAVEYILHSGDVSHLPGAD